MALKINIFRGSNRKALDLMSYVPASQNGITTLMPFYEFFGHWFTYDADDWPLLDQVEPEDQFPTRLFPKPKCLCIDARPDHKPGILCFHGLEQDVSCVILERKILEREGKPELIIIWTHLMRLLCSGKPPVSHSYTVSLLST
jgi:hypothetical protein